MDGTADAERCAKARDDQQIVGYLDARVTRQSQAPLQRLRGRALRGF